MFVLYSHSDSCENGYEIVELIACSSEVSRLEAIKVTEEKIARDTNVALDSYHRKLHALTEANPHDRSADLRLTDPERVQRYFDWIKPLQQAAFDQTIKEHGTHLLEMYPNVGRLKSATPSYTSFTIEEVEEV